NPMFIATTPALGVATLPELIAKAKAQPGQISCAVTGIGRLTHLTSELLQREAGIKLLTVPYTGGPAHAISDVVSGRVSFIIEGYAGIGGAIQSGAVKAIAVAAQKPLAEFPNLPTVAQTIPGFSATGWQVVVAPLGTPEPIVRKVSEDLRKVVSDPEFQQKIGTRGSYSRAMSPAEAISFVQAEQRKWRPVREQIAAKSNGSRGCRGGGPPSASVPQRSELLRRTRAEETGDLLEAELRPDPARLGQRMPRLFAALQPGQRPGGDDACAIEPAVAPCGADGFD